MIIFEYFFRCLSDICDNLRIFFHKCEDYLEDKRYWRNMKNIIE